MAERNGAQGTGRHGHKDTQEPWPHTKETGKRVGSEHESDRSHERNREHATAGAAHDRNQDADLKRREYRGDDGEIHHHTRTYMEQHDRGSDEHRGGQGRNDDGGHNRGEHGGRSDRRR